MTDESTLQGITIPEAVRQMLDIVGQLRSRYASRRRCSVVDWKKALDEVAKGYANGLRELRRHDPPGYPLEAHAAHLLASALTGEGSAPILEAVYWREYRHEGRFARARADLWRPGTEDHPELFAEVKLAGRFEEGKIGDSPIGKILPKYADDVWRLLVLADPPKPRKADRAFVLVEFGKPASLPKQARDGSPRAHAGNADEAWEKLAQKPQAGDPIVGFVGTAVSQTQAVVHVGASVTVPESQVEVRCTALTWVHPHDPWTTTWSTRP